MTTVLLIPASMIALQDELRCHPKLMEQLKREGEVKTFEDGLAIIATYCDVVLDGVYTANEISRLAEVLLNRLRDKRGAIAVITTSSHPQN